MGMDVKGRNYALIQIQLMRLTKCLKKHFLDYTMSTNETSVWYSHF
jgi:hypothetical protein